MKILPLLCGFAALLGLAGSDGWAADTLAVSFDARGPSSIKYHGVEVLDSAGPQVDFFLPVTKEGVKEIDPRPRELTFNEATLTQTAQYAFGQVRCHYVPGPSRLGLEITVLNQGATPVWLLSANLLLLKLPAPLGGQADQEGISSDSLDNVPIVLGDFGSGTVAFAGETFGEDYTLGVSRMKDRPANVYSCKIRIESHQTTDRENVDAPLLPGASRSYALSLRFGAAGSSVKSLAGELYAAYGKKFPAALKWPDRRPILALFASSPAKQHQSATNPRGWRNEPAWNTVTPAGRKKFRGQMLAWAENNVKEIKELGGQGMILWDIEGEEQPHPITYIGDPRLAVKMAPEMDAIADEFFKKFTESGLRVGVCIRPSKIRFSTDAAGHLKATHDHMVFDPVAEMSAKIDYAQKRWGCTLFYLDTDVTWAFEPPDQNGARKLDSWPMRADQLRRLAAKHPDVLIIPEFTSLGSYSHVSAYKELRSGTAATSERVLAAYPHAFSVIKMDDEKQARERYGELVAAVRRGDILLCTGWQGEAINRIAKSACVEAWKERR